MTREELRSRVGNAPKIPRRESVGGARNIYRHFNGTRGNSECRRGVFDQRGDISALAEHLRNFILTGCERRISLGSGSRPGETIRAQRRNDSATPQKYRRLLSFFFFFLFLFFALLSAFSRATRRDGGIESVVSGEKPGRLRNSRLSKTRGETLDTGDREGGRAFVYLVAR